MKDTKTSVLLVGPMPPPVQGISNVNSYMHLAFLEHGIPSITCNTSPFPSVYSNSLLKFLRIIPVAFAYITFLKHLPCASYVYISASGGPGMIYEAVFIASAAIARKKIFFHHHSFAYIVRHSLTCKAISRIFNAYVCHIFLGDLMKRKFCDIYSPLHSMVISNSAFLKPIPDHLPVSSRNSHGSFTFLHISNLSAEKGLYRFLLLAEYSLIYRPNWRFILGGPLPSNCHSSILKRINQLSNLNYVGVVHKDNKLYFYLSSSFFVFPSLYKNEAEPLVVLEAMSCGCIPLVYPVGLLTDIVGFHECVIEISDDKFPEMVLNSVDKVLNYGIDDLAIKMHARLQALATEASDNLSFLLDTLSDTPAESSSALSVPLQRPDRSTL